MAQGNKGFAERLAGAGAAAAPARLPPRTGILGARENRLAELAAGTAQTRIHELVDPALCRIWEGHNRDYAALSEQGCADLIESFRAQGRQEVPAIVRRLPAEAAPHRYEVICGARRHWTVTWLRANNHPEFRFLVEPRELTDEEAFRLADLENRNRRDLTDLERALDYARAVERYYGGSQQRMAERLEVSRSWLSRYLELARLPAPVLGAFAAPEKVGISHAAALAPLLRGPATSGPLLAEAEALVAEQGRRRQDGAEPLPPSAVLARLLRAARARPARAAPPREHEVRTPDGALLARGVRAGRGGALTVSIPSPGRHGRKALLAALGEILEHMAATAEGRGPGRGRGT